MEQNRKPTVSPNTAQRNEETFGTFKNDLLLQNLENICMKTEVEYDMNFLIIYSCEYVIKVSNNKIQQTTKMKCL